MLYCYIMLVEMSILFIILMYVRMCEYIELKKLNIHFSVTRL